MDLEWSVTEIGGHCTCPHHAKGYFCKHLVALGLAVLDQSSPRSAEDEGESDGLEQLDAAALRQLLRDLKDVAPEVARLMELRAAGVGVPRDDEDPERTEAESARLLQVVKSGLRTRGYVDYRQSFDVASDVQLVLDELERQVESGHGQVAQAALLYATTRMRRVIEHGDDSAGVLGDAGQRAAELYARACLAGHPKPSALARWLLKFRDTSPGWPQLELADFVGAFDDKALQVYRRGVAKLHEQYAGTDQWGRLEVDRMRLELADHDDDVDEAVAILSPDHEHAKYGAIVTRLREAGRDAEASGWIDRAVAEGRISSMHGSDNFWITPDDAARDLLQRDRLDDAIDVLRREVARATDSRPYQQLLDFAAPMGRRDVEEAWAKRELRAKAHQPHGNGALLVQIALAERDVAGAWEIADELGAGHAWQTLANASATDHPSRAASLRRARLEPDFAHADTRLYGPIARELRTIRDLMERAGEGEEFATYLSEIRQRYGRRPSFIAELDRRGLL